LGICSQPEARKTSFYTQSENVFEKVLVLPKVQGLVKRFYASQLEHFQYLLNHLDGSGFNNINYPNGLCKNAGIEVQTICVFAVGHLERFVTKSAVIAGK